MFNSKRISFIFIALSFFFVLFDTGFEKSLRVKLWSLFNTTVSEGSEISSSAPNSVFDTVESGRLWFVDTLNEQNNNSLDKLKSSTGTMTAVWYGSSFFLRIVSFLASYVIIFYPLILISFYFFFTSSLFRPKYDY
jgi:hypothetical protein